jgi:hypothetical protein
VGIEEVLGELCNALGIGLGLESETLALEKSLEFFVVGNDTIVNDCELPLGIRSVQGLVKAIWAPAGRATGEDGSSGWTEDRE